MNLKKVAIIGAGISGLSAAYLLKDQYHITLYEQEERLGGHSRTITIKPINSCEFLVDTGFIVLNNRTYPNLCNLFQKLNIDLIKTEMSFAVSFNNGDLEWAGTSIDTLFAQRKNIFNFPMLKGLMDLIKFNFNVYNYINKDPELTLQELVHKIGLGKWFLNYYLLPMASAIWSCPFNKILDFPATTFINFFSNHGLLSIYNRPQWYTLKNKSISYVKAIENSIKSSNNNEVSVNSKITSITREDQQVRIEAIGYNPKYFDFVVFSCHPVEILKILKDPSYEEKNILEKFSRQKNTAYTHKDINYMPKITKCWSSWNYICNDNFKESSASVTYWMNKLQHLDSTDLVFITLNPVNAIPEDNVYDVYDFYHPIFDYNAIIGQKMISDIQGKNQLWFCGAYLKYGFHEDGILSATLMKESLINQTKAI